MSDHPVEVDPAVLSRARSLVEALHTLSGLPDASRLRAGVESALAFAVGADARRPVFAALLGGTGAGKSALFNALLGRPEASPTSSAERGFTRVPYVASAPEDRAWLSGLEELHPEFVEAARPGLILIDTPDVDSVHRTNRDCARRGVEAADLVVYVASPDKRANFDVSEEVRAWGRRKRWFFVLTRADRLGADRDAARADFGKRIEELGFPSAGEALFLVDSTVPEAGEENGEPTESFDLDRLREILFASRTLEERRALREDAGLRETGSAVNPEGTIQHLRETAERGRAALDGLRERMRRIYAEYLLSPRRRFVGVALWRQRIWSLLGCRVRGPLALAVQARSRLAGMSLAVHLSRAEERGALKTGFRRVHALFGGTVSALHTLTRLGAEERRLRDRVAHDARRAAEDLGLGAVAQAGIVREDAPEEGEAISAMLDASLTRGATEVVSRRVRGWHVVLGNLLPVAVLARDLARLGVSWFEGQWLPAEFYYAALAMFAASLLPGYFLVAAAADRLARETDARVRAALDEVEAFEACDPLAMPLHRLETALRLADDLARAVGRARARLAPDLAAPRFGA